MIPEQLSKARMRQVSHKSSDHGPRTVLDGDPSWSHAESERETVLKCDLKLRLCRACPGLTCPSANPLAEWQVAAGPLELPLDLAALSAWQRHLGTLHRVPQ